MYSPQAINEIPGLIVAARDRDTETLQASTVAQNAEAINDSVTRGAFYSNHCSGAVAYTTPAKVRAGLNAAPEFAGALSLGAGNSLQNLFTVCQQWKLTAPAPLEHDAVASSVPILLLAGEFDPVTPPEWLPAASARFKRSYSVVISGAAHGSGLKTTCGYSIVTQFLQHPEQRPDTTCAGLNKVMFHPWAQR